MWSRISRHALVVCFLLVVTSGPESCFVLRRSCFLMTTFCKTKNRIWIRVRVNNSDPYGFPTVQHCLPGLWIRVHFLDPDPAVLFNADSDPAVFLVEKYRKDCKFFIFERKLQLLWYQFPCIFSVFFPQMFPSWIRILIHERKLMRIRIHSLATCQKMSLSCLFMQSCFSTVTVSRAQLLSPTYVL